MLRIITLLPFFILLSSCSNLLKPEYQEPTQRILPKDIPLKYQVSFGQQCYSVNEYISQDYQLKKLLDLSNSSYDLEEVRLDLKIQQAKEGESYWELYPSPSLNINQSKSNGSSLNNLSSLGIALPQSIQDSLGSSGDLYGYSFGVNNYEVDLWGRKKGRHEVSKNQVASAEHRVNDVRIKLRSAVFREYFNLKIALKLEKILSQKIDVINQVYNKSVKLFKNKQINRLKLGKELVSIKKMELLLLEIRESIDFSYNQLYFLTGEDSLLNKKMVFDNLLYIPVIDSNHININSSMLAKRPDLLIKEQQIKIDNEFVGIAKADYLPSVFLNANVNDTTSNKGDLFKNIDEDLRFGTSVNYSFDFGKKSALLEQASVSKEKSEIEYNKIFYQAFLEVKNIISSIEKLNQSIDVRKNILGELEKQIASIRRLHAVNRVSSSDLLKYEAEFLTEELELFRGYAELSKKSVALYEALGGDISLVNLCYADTDNTPMEYKN